MTSTIALPYGPKMGTCYETIEQATPELHAAFFAKVVGSTEKKYANPSDKLREMLDCAEEVYAAYLKHNDGQQMVVHGAWQCCVGDLADALVQQAIVETTEGKGTAEAKKEILGNLLDIVRLRLEDAPNQLMINFDIQGAINSL